MALSGSSQPPPAPDPYKTAQAQTGSNVETAIANSLLGNANEITPWGSVTYRQTGSTHIGGPTGTMGGILGTGSVTGIGGPRGANIAALPGYQGGPGSVGQGSYSQGYDIPTFERRITLSPEQQKLYDQQTQLGSQLNQFAIDQTGKLRDVLGRPIDVNSLPQRGTLPTGPQFAQMGQGPALDRIGNTDFSADRQRVEEAIMSRFNPQLDRDRAALEDRLVNQGYARGSDAFRQQMDELNRTATDARMQAILAGGQEQSRLADLTLNTTGFNNNAAQQEFQNRFNVTGFNNDTMQRDFANRMNLFEAADTQRERALQETLALRNQPINEISALMSGGQVTPPQFAQYKGGTVAPTNIGDYIYNTAALNNQNYNTQQQQQNAMMGGLFGLGSSALLGSMMPIPVGGTSLLGGLLRGA